MALKFFTNKELTCIILYLVLYFVNTSLSVHWFGNPGLRGETRNGAIPIISGNISPAIPTQHAGRVYVQLSSELGSRHFFGVTAAPVFLLDYPPSHRVSTDRPAEGGEFH